MLLWSPLCSRLSVPVSASRADPRVHHRTFSHVLRQNFPREAAHHTPSQRLRLAEPPHALSRATRGLGDPSHTLQALCVEVSDPRARLATLSSAWSWIPPCHVWSSFARRWNCLVPRRSARKRRSRDRALVCSGSSHFRRHPSQVINLSTDTIVPQLFPLRLAWSGCVRFGLRGALPPKLSESLLSFSECVRHSFPQLFPLRLGCVPRGQWAPGTSSTASGRCSRIYPSRSLEEGLVLPELLIPSCSCRSCHKE